MWTEPVGPTDVADPSGFMPYRGNVMNARFGRIRMRWAVSAVTAAVVAVSVTGLAPAQASGGASVSTTPAAYTPYITSANSTVDQIVQCGLNMYAVGAFSQVGMPNGQRFARSNAFSFNAATGAVTPWNPRANGEVSGIALTLDCTSAYLGGGFSSVQGTSISNLAKVDTTVGIADPAFRPQPNGMVFSLALTPTQLIVGGQFSKVGVLSRVALASVSPTTGAPTGYANLGVSGRIPGNSGSTKVFKLRTSPTGNRMLVLGNFATVSGQGRLQAFVANLGPSAMTLDQWYVPALKIGCRSDIIPYFVRGGTWSPDGTRIYLATTGGGGPSPLCDAASAFSSSSNSNQSAIWINKTGCDSLYSVAVDATTVYVGGHERYADNPRGCDGPGPGAVSRPGVGALSPSTGKALAWNPTRDRGHGADDELRTAAGLWVASDNFFNSVKCANAYHPGICFFPNG